MSAYSPRDFSHLLGTPGFSDKLLNDHFTLYQGYVKNTNALVEEFKADRGATPAFAEMKRRFGWEFDIEAFFKAVLWKRVSERLAEARKEAAVSIR